MKQKKVVNKKLNVKSERLSTLSKEELSSLLGGNLEKLNKINTIDLIGQLNRGYM